MTKRELHIIQFQVSRALLAMAVYEKAHLHQFRNREDVNTFEETNEHYKQLLGEWYVLAILAERLGVEWLDTPSSIKASEILTEIYRATKK